MDGRVNGPVLHDERRKGRVRAVEVRGGHVGSEEHRAHEILAGAGPHAALELVRCKDPQTHQMVAAAAADKDSWMARSQSFSLSLTPGALTTGCAPLSASAPARTARRIGPRPWPALALAHRARTHDELAGKISGSAGLGRRGRAGRGLPRPVPGAGSAGPGAAQRRRLIQYGTIRQRSGQAASGQAGMHGHVLTSR